AGLALPEAAALDGDKAWAEALEAREILVAARLVDRPLAPELGLHRHHRQAVRLGRAVAAAFADEVVDADAAGRVRETAALPAAALLGGAGLVVDDRGDAGQLAQLALHVVELVAVTNRRVRRELGAGWVFFGLVGDDDDRPDSFGRKLPRHRRHGQPAVERLAAGHRHRVVEQHLVGHADARRDGGADRHDAGM